MEKGDVEGKQIVVVGYQAVEEIRNSEKGSNCTSCMQYFVSHVLYFVLQTTNALCFQEGWIGINLIPKSACCCTLSKFFCITTCK